MEFLKDAPKYVVLETLESALMPFYFDVASNSPVKRLVARFAAVTDEA